MTIGTLASPPIPMLEVLERRPTSAMSEATLELGYSRQVVDRRPCLCGGEIAVFASDDVAIVVGSHNATRRHEAWAIANGYRDG